MLKHSALEGYQWVKVVLELFKKQPRKLLVVAFAYVVLFMILPALNIFFSLKMLLVVFSPFVLSLLLTIYQEVDEGVEAGLVRAVDKIKPQLSKLVVLGVICMAYGVLVSFITADDSKALDDLVKANAENIEVLRQALPLLIKVLIFFIPILVVTWFSPMLVAHHHFSVGKAIKSSIAGCITGGLSLTFAWVYLTAGLAIAMLLSGTVVAIISYFSAPLGTVLTSMTLLAFLLVATSFMLGLQYVSYRDIFAKKFS